MWLTGWLTALLLLSSLPSSFSQTNATFARLPPGINPDGSFDCICTIANDTSGDYICKCESDGGFDCLCTAVPDTPGDYDCKCGGSGKPSGPSEGTTLPTPGPGQPTPPAGGHNKTVKTFVVCAKLDSETDKPTSTILATKQGKSITVYGEWVGYHCNFGYLEAFVVNKTVFDDLKNQCEDKDYDHPQPSDDSHIDSYPFLVDGILTEYYRHKTAFTFNHSPPTPLDRCKESRRRRHRH